MCLRQPVLSVVTMRINLYMHDWQVQSGMLPEDSWWGGKRMGGLDSIHWLSGCSQTLNSVLI